MQPIFSDETVRGFTVPLQSLALHIRTHGHLDIILRKVITYKCSEYELNYTRPACPPYNKGNKFFLIRKLIIQVRRISIGREEPQAASYSIFSVFLLASWYSDGCLNVLSRVKLQVSSIPLCRYNTAVYFVTLT